MNTSCWRLAKGMGVRHSELSGTLLGVIQQQDSSDVLLLLPSRGRAPTRHSGLRKLADQGGRLA